MKYPTLKDVARLADTSIATVSYVLNETKGRYITDELRQRVLDAARELHYTKSLVASGLKGKSRKLFSLLVPQLSNILFTNIALGIEEIAFESGYVMNICNTFDNPNREKEIIDQAISQRVDGLLVCGTEWAFENLTPIQTYGIPFVAVERPLSVLDESEYNFVGSNNLQAGAIAGRHLVEKGHRRLAYIEWMRNVINVTNRRIGFETAISSHIDVGGSCFIRSSRELSAERGYQLTSQLLEAEAPTAILYGHHVLAEGGVRCLRDMHLDIPGDISVIIIGLTDWSQMTIPPFTCVRQPASEIGMAAAKLLIDIVESQEHNPPGGSVQRLLDCTLISRDTVKDLDAK